MFSDEIEETMAKAVVTSLVFMYGWIKDYSDAVTTDQDPSFLGDLKEGFTLIRAIFVQLFISGLTILRQFSIISNVLSVIAVVLAICGFIKVLSVAKNALQRSLKKKRSLLPITSNKRVVEAGSQTESVLSLSLIAPLTKEFGDFFINTLAGPVLKVCHDLNRRSGEIPLQLPHPIPRPPLSGHTLDKKPLQTEKNGSEALPVYANISVPSSGPSPKSCKPKIPLTPLVKSLLQKRNDLTATIHECDVPTQAEKSAVLENRSEINDFCDLDIQFNHREYEEHRNSYIPKSNMKFVNFGELCDAGEDDWPLQRTQSSCLSFQMDKVNGVSAQNEWDKMLGLPPV